MKKEGIQTRKRKPKNLNKPKPGMCYTVVFKAGGGWKHPRGQCNVVKGSNFFTIYTLGSKCLEFFYYYFEYSYTKTIVQDVVQCLGQYLN